MTPRIPGLSDGDFQGATSRKATRKMRDLQRCNRRFLYRAGPTPWPRRCRQQQKSCSLVGD